MKINIFIWQLEERFYLVKWLKNEVEQGFIFLIIPGHYTFWRKFY